MHRTRRWPASSAPPHKCVYKHGKSARVRWPRAPIGGVCAHTGDRVTWVRRGTVPSVKMTLTVRKNVFFVFPIFAGTIFSKRLSVKVREVRSTQGCFGWQVPSSYPAYPSRMLGKLYHSSINEHKGPRTVCFQNFLHHERVLVNSGENSWVHLSLRRLSAPCPPYATSTTTTRRRTAATTASSPARGMICVMVCTARSARTACT